jgi:hypothetical protein
MITQIPAVFGLVLPISRVPLMYYFSFANGQLYFFKKRQLMRLASELEPKCVKQSKVIE